MDMTTFSITSFSSYNCLISEDDVINFDDTYEEEDEVKEEAEEQTEEEFSKLKVA